MAPHTTPTDVATFTGQTFTDAQITRMAVLIPRAERWIRQVVGVDFYEASDVASDASQDWLLATSLVVEHYLHDEDPKVKAAAAGVYQSEKLGDYSYTLKDAASMSSGANDAQIAALLAPYMTVTVPGLVMNGPTRVAPPVCDPEWDVSRGQW